MRLSGKQWSLSKAVKPHGTTHFPSQSQNFGHNRSSTDSTPGERFHPRVKEAFNFSSKRTTNSPVEIVLNIIRKDRAVALVEGLHDYIPPVNLTLDDEGFRKSISCMGVQYQFNNQVGLPQLLICNVIMGTPVLQTYVCFMCCGPRESLCTMSNALQHSANMHSSLSPEILVDLLQRYASKNSPENTSVIRTMVMQALQDKACCMKLWSEVKVRGDLQQNYRDFHVHANANYLFNHNAKAAGIRESPTINNYSFVFVKNMSNEPGEELVRVLAIIQIDTSTSVRNCSSSQPHVIRQGDIPADLLIIARLTPTPMLITACFLPYETYMYKVVDSYISFRVVPISHITRPAFVMPVNTTSSFFKESVSNMKSLRFYVIPIQRGRGMQPVPYVSLSRLYPRVFLTEESINSQAMLIDEILYN